MFDKIVSEFGTQAKAKLANPAVTGAPEDQLRAPLEAMLTALGEVTGLPRQQITLVGESTLGMRPVSWTRR